MECPSRCPPFLSIDLLKINRADAPRTFVCKVVSATPVAALQAVFVLALDAFAMVPPSPCTAWLVVGALQAQMVVPACYLYGLLLPAIKPAYPR